jgi:drug/metabolite transporter (DMT)-like permease
MFYYFLACVCSVLSYDLARSLTTFPSKISLFQNNQLPVPTLHMFWYADIMILFVVAASGVFAYRLKGINVYSPKFYLRNKKITLLLLLPIVAANAKSVLSGTVTGNVIINYSLLTPFVVCILTYFLFKEKLPRPYILAFLLASVGFLLTRSQSSLSFSFNFFLFSYIFLNAFSIVAVRYASLNRSSIEGIIIENLIYASQGFIFFWIFGSFKWEYLFTWQVLLVALPSIGHHILVILGNQRSKYTAGILLIDFTKVGIVYLSTYAFFGKTFSTVEIVGVITICGSICLLKTNLVKQFWIKVSSITSFKN